MRLWLNKDIFFGYQYTSNKKYRDLINNYFEYLSKLLLEKGSKDDCFIICGGLFSNTNPSIVAITDAITNIKKISSIMNVYIINSNRDNRKFDNDYYTTIDILHDLNNVFLIKDKTIIDGVYLIPTDIINTENKSIVGDDMMFILDNNTINIPSAIQFTDTMNNIGLLVYDTVKQKQMVIKNNTLPKHVKHDINSFEELENINIDTIDHIHLLIDYTLKDENETKLNILLSKINPHSYNFKNKKIKERVGTVYNMGQISIIDIIKKEINDDLVKEQFERVLKINNK